MKLLEVSEEDARLISMLLEDRDEYNKRMINTNTSNAKVHTCANEHIRINLLLDRINKLREPIEVPYPLGILFAEAKDGKYATPKDIAKPKPEAKEVAEAKPKSKGIDLNIVINNVEDLAPLISMIVNHG